MVLLASVASGRTVRAPCAVQRSAKPADIDCANLAAWLSRTDDDAASPDAATAAEELSPADAYALVTASGGGALPPTLLDLRTREQHGSARPDAPLVSMPAGDPGTLGLLFRFSDTFVADVGASYSHDTPLVLLCEFGIVSRVAAARLLAAGHTSVQVVRGGFEAWTLDGTMPTLGGAPSDAGWVAAPPADADADGEAFELEPWPTNADGTPSPIQPRPYGALDSDGEGLATEEEEEMAMMEEAEVAEEAPPASSVTAEVDAAISAAQEAAAEEEKEEIDPSANPLAGDDLDDDLATMVAELDAPVRAPGQSLAALAPETSKPVKKGQYRTSPVGSGERKRRGRTASDPAWLVDVSAVDFAAALREDRLSKLSVKELKSYLYGKGEVLGGNKQTLVLRVAECVAAEGNGGGGGAVGGGSSSPGGGGGDGGGLQQQQQQQAQQESGQQPLANGFNGASVAATAPGAAAGGGVGRATAEEEELARLDTLPPPSDGDEVPLELFNPDGTASDAADADDFLIDEVFSSM
jgi:rhodanese-related sulfurtransferase